MTEIHCPKCGGEAQIFVTSASSRDEVSDSSRKAQTQNGKMSTTYVCECNECGHTWEVVG